MEIRPLVIVGLLAIATSAQAVTPSASAEQRIPSPGGEVVLIDQAAQKAYSSLRYAPVRRAGGLVFVSGVIAGAPGPESVGPAEFQQQVERAFELIGSNLKAAGSDWSHVVKINSFHVWSSPRFRGSKQEHFGAFAAAKDKFVKQPYPAWTAVGTTELLGTGGLVEVEVIAIEREGR